MRIGDFSFVIMDSGRPPGPERRTWRQGRWYLAAIAWKTFFGSQLVSSSMRTTP
jgi:hypothetical protein